MESQNDYDREVFNGDLGTVARIDEDEGAGIVSFEGREVVYPFGELDTLVPAYAVPIHKLQDPDYATVVIRLSKRYLTMQARNLLCMTFTRGKRLLVMIGQRRPSVLGSAVAT